jgi:hypothetical protein
MSYNNAGLRCLIPALGSGPAVWYYSTTDAHTDVDATDYFTDGATFGLKANDVMHTDTNTATIHKVASATTIAAATLA